MDWSSVQKQSFMVGEANNSCASTLQYTRLCPSTSEKNVSSVTNSNEEDGNSEAIHGISSTSSIHTFQVPENLENDGSENDGSENDQNQSSVSWPNYMACKNGTDLLTIIKKSVKEKENGEYEITDQECFKQAMFEGTKLIALVEQNTTQHVLAPTDDELLKLPGDYLEESSEGPKGNMDLDSDEFPFTII